MIDHPVRAGLDALALVALLGAWADHLPAVAALMGAAWYAIQIYEWVSAKFIDKDKK